MNTIINKISFDADTWAIQNYLDGKFVEFKPARDAKFAELIIKEALLYIPMTEEVYIKTLTRFGIEDEWKRKRDSVNTPRGISRSYSGCFEGL